MLAILMKTVCEHVLHIRTARGADIVYDIASRYDRLENTIDPIHFMFEDVRPN